MDLFVTRRNLTVTTGEGLGRSVVWWTSVRTTTHLTVTTTGEGLGRSVVWWTSVRTTTNLTVTNDR